MAATETGIYLDTSALLPYYREEALSEQVQTMRLHKRLGISESMRNC